MFKWCIEIKYSLCLIFKYVYLFLIFLFIIYLFHMKMFNFFLKCSITSTIHLLGNKKNHIFYSLILIFISFKESFLFCQNNFYYLSTIRLVLYMKCLLRSLRYFYLIISLIIHLLSFGRFHSVVYQIVSKTYIWLIFNIFYMLFNFIIFKILFLFSNLLL